MLGFDKLQTLVKEQRLIEEIHESELSKDGGVAFDLRIGEIHEFVGEGFLGINDRKTPDTSPLGVYEEGKSTKVFLEPNKYYVIKTIEKVNTPEDAAWLIIPRSTVFRSGLLLLGGLGDPGFRGKVTSGLINLTDKPFTLELGSKIANIIFYKVEGSAKAYKGRYQGGKLGTKP
ncbi:MAG: hypothetical protein ACE5DM_03065 [Candidatus Nanoarchaeia archaeon]